MKAARLALKYLRAATLLGVFTIVIAFGLASPGHAAATCTPSTSGIAFGDVTQNLLSNTTADVTGTISITCSSLSATKAYTLCISIDNYNGTNANRTMSSGSNSLLYQIYQDSAHTVPWGDTATDSLLVQFTSTSGGGYGGPAIYLYGRVLTGQGATPIGSYLQNLTSANNAVYVVSGTQTSCTNVFTGTKTNFTFSDTASVSSSCNVSANALSFGTGTLLTAAALATSTVAATCTSGATYNVGLDAGTATGATVTTRKMLNGSYTLNYSLYRDSARTLNWGNTVGTDTLAGTGAGTTLNLTVYGRVPTQSARPGTYADTITVTVTH